MKKFQLLFMMLIFAGLMTGCNKDELASSNEIQLKSAHPITVTVPFEVNLLGEITSIDYEAQECIDEGYAVRAIVETTGTASHMGKVSLTFDFCTLGAPDPDVEGSVYTYVGCAADLIAANGDVLYLSLSDGTAIGERLAEHPEYVDDYWRGTVTILGGTGKFAGASGVLTQEDYTSTEDEYTHHHFYGEITLVKGKR